MRKIFIVVSILSVAVLSIYSAIKPLSIVVSTSHIEAICVEIGREQVEINCLIPGGSCPGHFDISVEGVKKIKDADVFITHIWEKRFDDIMGNVSGKSHNKIKAETPGNWMVPDYNINAIEEIAGILSRTKPDLAEYFKENEKKYSEKIRNSAEKVKRKFSAHIGKSVICSEHQKEFLEWLGFKAAAFYGRPEDLSLKEVKQIMVKAKQEGAVLVVDNLQSGPEAGLAMAKDLKIAHITLNNFPIEGSYIRTLETNCDIILKALK